MNHQTCTLRSLLAVMVATAALPVGTASARDRIRIPLPPPPSEVIRDVRGFIHGIGKGIKRGAQRVFNDSEDRERRQRELPRPRRDYGPAEDWDGEFYPDEYDRPGARRPQSPPPPQYRREGPPREDLEGPDGWTSEEQLRQEEAARNYRPSPGMEPAPADSRKRTQPQPDTKGFRAPAPPPQPPTSTSPPSRGNLKESTPAPAPGPTSSDPKTTTPSSDVKYATPVPGKKGLVYPPGVEQKAENMVDVGDFQRGQLVRNPRTGELFRVP